MIEQKTTIKNLALIAGVHGNELTPAYLVKYLQNSPNLLARSSFQSYSLIANPLALKQRVRYIDTDLNRCFNQKDLVNPDCQSTRDNLCKIAILRFFPLGRTSGTVTVKIESHLK